MVNAFLRSMRMLTDVLALSMFFISIFALVGMQLFVGVLRNKCVLNPGVNVTDFDAFVANESKLSPLFFCSTRRMLLKICLVNMSVELVHCVLIGASSFDQLLELSN